MASVHRFVSVEGDQSGNLSLSVRTDVVGICTKYKDLQSRQTEDNGKALELPCFAALFFRIFYSNVLPYILLPPVNCPALTQSPCPCCAVQACLRAAAAAAVAETGVV